MKMRVATWKSGVAVGLAAVMVASAASALVVMFQGPNSANAEEARTQCVRALRATRSWRAKYVETQKGSDGTKSVVRTEVTVRQPGDFRMVVRERDESGNEVVSTTIRSGDTLYTRRVGETGEPVLHIMKGVRPSLGIEMDNALGETVQSVAEATTLKVVGSESVRGRSTRKLELAPDRFVWIDSGTGLPVREREMSGETVQREVGFESFDAEPVVTDADFAISSLGSVESTVVEDLGYRPVASPTDAWGVLGFEPVELAAPAGYTVLEQGYCDPGVSAGDREPEAAFVTLLSDGTDSLLVTQTSRPGLGDTMYPVGGEAPDAPRVVDVGGRAAMLYSDTTGGQLTLARRDILVSVEGNVSDETLIAFGNTIR